MTTGFLVNPDLTYRTIEFDLEEANQFLGGTMKDRIAVSFQEDGGLYAALYSPQAKENRAEPNPVASLARNTAATGNPAFLTDPTAAISGPVIFVEAEGDENIDFVVEAVKSSIRAVRNYREDNEEEYRLWRAAVLNMGTIQE
ncbi:hypothetical protein [Corynebacterium cystitidis]|uniref:hypothetical protein n=1 Tax=Corynebacterium cystitidis TaxID=35757 RepID=UPI00211ED4DF|nr:hypothetical protein [Corynebacterium cystitidis]